jgi:hypothetical protein
MRMRIGVASAIAAHMGTRSILFAETLDVPQYSHAELRKVVQHARTAEQSRGTGHLLQIKTERF